MDMIRLLILYEDQEYGFALAKTISNLHKDFLVTAEAWRIFSHKELPAAFDLVLAEESEEACLHCLPMAKNRVVLLREVPGEKLDHQLKTEEDGRNFFYLYKYAPVSRIVADLRYIYGYLTGRKNLVRYPVETQVVGFYSASGGTGKSAVALSVARELRKYHDKMVLYITFDLISAASFYMKGAVPQRSLEDYLYYLFNKDKETLCSYIDSFVFVDDYGVHTFLPSADLNELNQLNSRELSHLLEFLLTSNKYDYIILDLSPCFHEGTLLLLTLCRKLFLIESDCPLSRYKTEKFKTFLAKRGEEEGIRCPLLRVINKVSPDAYLNSPLEPGCEAETAITIERDDDSFHQMDGCLDISLNHLFGMGIRKIVDEIL